MSKLDEVAAAVAKGKVKIVAGLTQEALDEGFSAAEILNEGMIGAMAVVGEKFKNNEIFVPEMLIAARAMKKGVEVLTPHLKAAGTESKGKLILGTVAGDLHDIGNPVLICRQNIGIKRDKQKYQYLRNKVTDRKQGYISGEVPVFSFFLLFTHMSSFIPGFAHLRRKEQKQHIDAVICPYKVNIEERFHKDRKYGGKSTQS